MSIVTMKLIGMDKEGDLMQSYTLKEILYEV